jgi:hypothetical protein
VRFYNGLLCTIQTAKSPQEIEQGLHRGTEYLNENPRSYKWKKVLCYLCVAPPAGRSESCAHQAGIIMNDDPMAMADRLTRYVDELIEFRRQRNTARIASSVLMINNVLDKLKQAYTVALFPPGIVERIRRDKKRANLLVPLEDDEF